MTPTRSGFARDVSEVEKIRARNNMKTGVFQGMGQSGVLRGVRTPRFDILHSNWQKTMPPFVRTGLM
jgi:hypothetical protein